MNILMMTLLYPRDQHDEVSRNAKDKLQNQINNYQYAFIEGICGHLQQDDKLTILNSLPVGIYPLQYKKLVLKHGIHDNGQILQIGCINLPWLKQKMRSMAAYHTLIRWVKENTENRTILVYTQYLPYMEAILKVKRKFPDLKAAVIVTDLPNEMGLPSGRKGLLKKIEYRMGERSLKLLRQMDGYVLLTEPMAEALNIRQKPYTVIEGLILSEAEKDETSHNNVKPYFLYTGTLEKSLGINEMLQAFSEMPEYDLKICGHGNMNAVVESYAKRFSNIHFYGFVAQKEALALQANASGLLNPRPCDGVFTRYSFPSKTLEYMRSGKPVLCCRLEGIPAEYDSYLQYMEDGKDGIKAAVHKLMKLSAAERIEIGNAGRSYVLKYKNPSSQCVKLLQLLRRM